MVQNKSRLIARLGHELLDTTAFATLADLTDALKFRCAQLRLAVTPDDVTNAYRLIAARRSLVQEADR